MVRPTGRSLLLVGAGLPIAALPAVIDAEWWVLWIGWLALLVLLHGLELLAAAAPRSVAMRLDAPAAMQVGAEHGLVAHVAGPRSLRRVTIALAASGALEPPPVAHAATTAGAVSAHFAVRPRRRGPAAITAVWLRWAGPFRLLWRERRFAVDCTIDVLPDTRALRALALRMRARPEFRAGLKVEHYLGDGSEFDALREWVTGFDRRTVDWKASARHRQLLCRQYRAERNHQVVLAIDTGNRMGELLGGVARVDHAITAALQLAFTCLKTGDLVGAYAFAERPHTSRRPEAGLQAMAGIQACLGGLDYSLAETNYTVALTHLVAEVRRRSLIVLFTEFTDSITAELMVQNVLRLARRHLVVFVALRDDTLTDAVAAQPHSLLDVHRAVIAGELQQERVLVLERIRRAGVGVIDAAPQHVGAELINRYLDIKRREAV